MMIDFTDQQEVNHWRITNDGVMGGLSKGYIKAEQEQGVFSGSISLKNSGGFSSVFRKITPLSSDLNSVVINIQGDGLTYQLRVVINVDGYRLAYKYPFKTSIGQREQLIFRLADFQASFRGREISNAPLLNANDIQEVGFLVTNKEESNFALSIISLSFIEE